ncbi:MAG: hypothetical protein ACTS5F_00610 [Candidatus Hodgkinia cicadicola]
MKRAKVINLRFSFNFAYAESAQVRNGIASMLSAHFGGSPKGKFERRFRLAKLKLHFERLTRALERNLSQRSSGEDGTSDGTSQAAAVDKFKRNKPKEDAAAFMKRNAIDVGESFTRRYVCPKRLTNLTKALFLTSFRVFTPSLLSTQIAS